MKKVFKILLLVSVMLICAIGLIACENGSKKTEKGLLYKMYQGDSFYTVYGYVDDGKKVDTLDISQYNKDGVSIGRIKANAFKDNDTLKNIIVPSSVTTIDSGAFAKMKKLESITLPFVGKTGVADTSFNSIDGKADKSVDSERLFGYIFGTEEYTGGALTTQYYDSTNTLVCYLPVTLKKVVIDGANNYGIPMYAFDGVNVVGNVELKNVEIIGDCAFKDAKGLSNITLPNTLTTINKEAFSGTVNLKALSLNQGLIEIGASAFNGSGIKELVLPNTVEEIGLSCFANSKIEKMTLSSGMEIIPTGAFYNAEYLTEITIPAEIYDINPQAFMGCMRLMTVNNTNTWTAKNGSTTITSITLTTNELVSFYVDYKFTKE